MKELESMIYDYQKKRINTDDAVRRLVEFMYRNKNWFGLNRLVEDEFHDFLLETYPLFSHLFKNYDSTKGDFTCYVFGNVTQAYHGWKRINSSHQIRKITLEEIECSRLKTEESLYVSDILSVPEYCPEKTRLNIKYRKKTAQRMDDLEKESQQEKFMQETVLILMVKSWYMIEHSLVEKISLFTGIPTDTLTEILNKTKELMSDKTEKINKLKSARNTRYFYKELYRMKCNSTYGMNLAYLINRKQEYHSNKWRKSIERIRIQNKKLIPSNRIVGLILGIDQRRVQYLLQKANREHGHSFA